MTQPVGGGVVGVGSVSERYLRNLTASPHLEVIGCADQDVDRARLRAAELACPGAARQATCSRIPQVELVINLTVPSAHEEVTLAALAAGKHVYSEKPLATTRSAAACIIEVADKAGLTFACAPHTFLRAGIQTCLRLLEQGDLGEPAALADRLGDGVRSYRRTRRPSARWTTASNRSSDARFGLAERCYTDC